MALSVPANYPGGCSDEELQETIQALSSAVVQRGRMGGPEDCATVVPTATEFLPVLPAEGPLYPEPAIDG